MPAFTYEAMDRAGKTVAGTLQADDDGQVVARLREQGLFPMNVRRGAEGVVGSSGRRVVGLSSVNGGSGAEGAVAVGEPAVRALNSQLSTLNSTRKRVSRMDIALMTRQLSDLLDAGLPMDRTLTVLIDQTGSEGLKQALTRVQAEIRSGKPLSEAIAAFPRLFPTLYVNMVRAGEASGQLADVTMRLADFMEREQVRRSQLISALTYPVVLIVVALSAVTFLLLFALPKLTAVFDQLDAALPLPTQVLLGITAFLNRYWWLVLAVLAAAELFLRQWRRTAAGRTASDAFLLRLPLFGPIIRKATTSRFARTLGTLLAGGVPILTSMEIARDAVGNRVVQRAVDHARGEVQQGTALAPALDETGAFMPVLGHMAAVGEETGRLPQMLIRTSDTLDFDVDATLKRLTTMVEPIIVLTMGAFVGFVVLSILLPIFEANNAIR